MFTTNLMIRSCVQVGLPNEIAWHVKLRNSSRYQQS